ncbi:pseudouridine-5'-phosphate glycosidase [Hydrogenispora ethanolica]|uniref:Pseudouridine-5'-phosphate glycosidase n=1 Tax=Hydrogenispora ethanolica TaxID=1082276 RepID=A0A4R1SB57_HYDET|nr:pseudouridine-5'-phosphate glycosidase [Hydrogenispora ethanolica]TCL76776.1 pseudouridine-5'-phosphate glycosidase [Hydrogenispora ethanolica]
MADFAKYLDIHPEVAAALAGNRPVVALESTIISHGMPYPENLNTAKQLEAIIRENGAVPATIAIMAGRITVGLNEEQLQQLATAHDVLKVSRRDIPYAVALGKTGATTVAATMIGAALAGVRFFATGGIGGVHRGAAQSMDISADLTELAQTSVAVICAGAKSILDIGLTLEKLETLGVPVLGYQTTEFPAFYNRKSGYGVDYPVATPEECARILQAKWELGLDGGVVIANPVPEAFEAPAALIDEAIAAALAEAAAGKVKGKEVTPFLLAKVKELTAGESLETNMALVKNNAELAARIAVAYSGRPR